VGANNTFWIFADVKLLLDIEGILGIQEFGDNYGKYRVQVIVHVPGSFGVA
jgi:hypothetical protein